MVGTFLRVKNFEFQCFEGFQKIEYFLGYDEIVDIFWGHIFRGHVYTF